MLWCTVLELSVLHVCVYCVVYSLLSVALIPVVIFSLT